MAIVFLEREMCLRTHDVCLLHPACCFHNGGNMYFESLQSVYVEKYRDLSKSFSLRFSENKMVIRWETNLYTVRRTYTSYWQTDCFCKSLYLGVDFVQFVFIESRYVCRSNALNVIHKHL